MRVFRVFFTAALLACAAGVVSAVQSPSGGGNQTQGDPAVTARATVRKAKIKSKPAPHYPEEAVAYDAGAVVRLRVILRASGEVTDINTMKVEMTKDAPKELADAFIREATRAAEKIKFQPAQKDGQTVSQYVVLEYAFTRR
ncbi:MAG TPA: TonB family protein [Pyrinomonadaceae bacterium]|jgi:TonB family protein